MSADFTYAGQRIRFSSGEASRTLSEEIVDLDAPRVMVICSQRTREVAEVLCEDIAVMLWWHEIEVHVPAETAARAVRAALEEDIDALIAIGGGSAIGLGKAVAVHTSIRLIALPTTYSGSEATNVWGITDGSVKRTGVDDRALPASVVYDAELTISLSKEQSVVSGLNSIAHCIDSLWGPRANPINCALATEGLRTLSEGLLRINTNGNDLNARELCLYGSYLGARAFASAGAGMHHRICHVLGGTFNLPHAATHAVMLPYIMRFNSGCAPAAMNRVAIALGCDDAHRGLIRIYERLDPPRALGDLGFTERDVPRAVARCLPAIPADNPRQVSAENLTALLFAATTGATYDPELP